MIKPLKTIRQGLWLFLGYMTNSHTISVVVPVSINEN